MHKVMTTPSKSIDILCIGAVLWDIIGRADIAMKAGFDVPGRITRRPGGVALNIAMTLRKQGLKPAVLSAVGQDAEGETLVAALTRLGLATDYLLRTDRPTDVYMAIEGRNGLIAAIADAWGLEAAGEAILFALKDGSLADPDHPWTRCVALDGNLTEPLLAQMARSAVLARADMRIAPASPGKALRLKPMFGHPTATFYVNLIEANLISNSSHQDTRSAAQALRDMGAARVVVTDGANPASFVDKRSSITQRPPCVDVKRVTGAGDTFMAAHIAAECRGTREDAALQAALTAAAEFISSEDSP